MRTLSYSLARIGSGAFLALTSMFCLLAYIPYTYLFLVKEPPMHWLVFFIHHHSALYWTVFAVTVFAYWPLRKARLVQAALAIQAALGIVFTALGYIPGIRNNIWALVTSLVVLIPVLCAAIAAISHEPYAETGRNGQSTKPGNTARHGRNQKHDTEAAGAADDFGAAIAGRKSSWIAKIFVMSRAEGLKTAFAGEKSSQTGEDLAGGNTEDGGFPFSTAALAGALIALVSVGGSIVNGAIKLESSNVRTSWLELAALVIVTHVWLAIAAAFLANVMLAALRKTRSRWGARRLAVTSLVCVAWSLACAGFLQDSLTFRGWASWTYSALFAVTITLLGYSALRPALGPRGRLWIFAITIALIALIIFTPERLKDADWNGVINGSIWFLLWIFATLSIFLVRPALKTYRLTSLMGVAVIAGAVYWGTVNTAFLWARELGTTEGAISRSIENYAQENTSFSFARSVLAGRGKGESCGELCQTLRQYANIRDARAPFEVDLVDHLEPAKTRPPDIYMIVIDSARRDYVGAYNPKVDFTPNLDAPARDSFVIRNAYTQYAGTTLSEAVLWTGVLPLHAHYMQPFDRLNNLARLLKAENYQVSLSYDSILRQIVPDGPDLVKFDLNKSWNEFGIDDSLAQLKTFMESPARDRDRPLFFYTQPLNVHQFFGDTSKSRSGGWKEPAGFNGRIALHMNQVDEALGGFFRYLKARGLYDNSIIIITSDHGDATGELGRTQHSTIIFPEVMQVPLIVHVPESMRRRLVYDETSISTLTDVTPTLFYLLGQGPLKSNRFFGRPLFTRTREEMKQYPRDEVFLASDVRATYGLLTGDGRYMFTIYDSPLKSYLFDLQNDPTATNNILTDASRREYQQRIAKYLHDLAAFYRYKPRGESTFSHKDCILQWC